MIELIKKYWKYAKYVLYIAVGIALIYLVRTCGRKDGVTTKTVFKKGQDHHYYHTVTKDSLVIKKQYFETKSKPVIVYVDSSKMYEEDVPEMIVRKDLVKDKGITVSIIDTSFADGTIRRNTQVTDIDTTIYVLRTSIDSTSRADTLYVKEKGLGWKRFKQGFATGVIVGTVGTALILK